MRQIPDDLLKEFLTSEESNTGIFLEIFESLKPSGGEKTFDVLDQPALTNLWNKVHFLANTHLPTLLLGDPGRSDSKAEDEGSVQNQEEFDLSRRIFLTVIKLCKLACSSSACHSEDNFLKTASLLHSVIPNLEEGLELKAQVVDFCETAWKKNLPNKESLSINTIQELLVSSIQPKATKSLVGRVWSMHRSVLTALQHQTQHAALFSSQLEACFKSNLYLDTKQGASFLSWLLKVDGLNLQRVHDTVISQLFGTSFGVISEPAVHRRTTFIALFFICFLVSGIFLIFHISPVHSVDQKHAETYGKIYFKAWVASNEFYRKKLEDYLSDVINITIHFDRKAKPSSFSHLCKFLNYFHQRKYKDEVASLLIKLYDPIIWRSLKVANYKVRQNAAHLMFDVFPLVTPDTKQEQELSLGKQYNTMVLLLEDSVPDVRCTAAAGIFKCLNVNWENLPADVIRRWLKVLLGPCLHDGNSFKLRSTVVYGLCGLLDNPLCHETIKAVVPKLGNSFHDVSENVRMAVCLFLKKIKSLEGFQYWEVVPVEHLLARLEEDSPQVCEMIVDLSNKNFMPPNKSEELMLERSFFLFKTNVNASRIYIRHWALLASLDVVVSFMKLWNSVVLTYVIENSKLNDSYASSEDFSLSRLSTNRDPEFKEGSSLDDPIILCGIMDALCISWKINQQRLFLPENKKLLKELLIVFETSLPKMLLFFRNGPSIIWNPLLLFASSLGLEELRPHLGVAMSRLSQMSDSSVSSEAISPLVGSIIYQGRGKELLEIVVDWLARGHLSSALKGSSGTPRTRSSLNTSGRAKSAKSKKQVCFVEKPAKPCLALFILTFLMKNSELQVKLLGQLRSMILDDLLPVLAGVKNLIEDSLDQDKTVECSQEMIVDTFSLYCHIIVLLHKEDDSSDFDSVRTMEELLTWISSTLIPPLAAETGQSDPGNATGEEGPRESRSSRSTTQRKRKKTDRSDEQDSPVNAASQALHLTKVYLACASDMLLLGIYDNDFLSSLFDLVGSTIKMGSGGQILEMACRCLCLLVDQMVLKEVVPTDVSISLVSSLLSTIMWKINFDYSNKAEAVARQTLLSCEKPLIQAFHSLFLYFGKSGVLVAELMALLLASTLASITNTISKTQEIEVSQVTERPAVARLILDHLIQRSQIGQFVFGMATYLKDVQQPLQILSLVHCLHYTLTLTGKDYLSDNIDEFKDAVQTAEDVLLQVAYNVKEKYAENENLDQIPEVIYCRWCRKLLKEIKQEITGTH